MNLRKHTRTQLTHFGTFGGGEIHLAMACDARETITKRTQIRLQNGIAWFPQEELVGCDGSRNACANVSDARGERYTCKRRGNEKYCIPEQCRRQYVSLLRSVELVDRQITSDTQSRNQTRKQTH